MSWEYIRIKQKSVILIPLFPFHQQSLKLWAIFCNVLNHSVNSSQHPRVSRPFDLDNQPLHLSPLRHTRRNAQNTRWRRSRQLRPGQRLVLRPRIKRRAHHIFHYPFVIHHLGNSTLCLLFVAPRGFDTETLAHVLSVKGGLSFFGVVSVGEGHECDK